MIRRHRFNSRVVACLISRAAKGDSTAWRRTQTVEIAEAGSHPPPKKLARMRALLVGWRDFEEISFKISGRIVDQKRSIGGMSKSN
jgi:hypothetical protein